jgi:hypothetical protein
MPKEEMLEQVKKNLKLCLIEDYQIIKLTFLRALISQEKLIKSASLRMTH